MGKTRSHRGQTEGAQCPAERDLLGPNKADQKNAAIITIRVTAAVDSGYSGVVHPQPRTGLEAIIQGVRPTIPSAPVL